jgi:hypothetical protein
MNQTRSATGPTLAADGKKSSGRDTGGSNGDSDIVWPSVLIKCLDQPLGHQRNARMRGETRRAIGVHHPVFWGEQTTPSPTLQPSWQEKARQCS